MPIPEPSKLAAVRPTANAAVWTVQLPNGQQHGPLSNPEIQSLVESGVIPPSSLAWNSQVGAWQRVVDIMRPVVASLGDSPSSSPSHAPRAASPSAAPELAQLFDHIQGDRQRISVDRQRQTQSELATAKEIKTVSEFAGKAVATSVGIVLLMIAVLAWAGVGLQNFNLGRAALLPVFLAGATAALISWILPYFYSSGRRRK